MSGRAERLERRRLRGGRARTEGRAAEVLAAFWLMAHGWRILGFRQRFGGVEADFVARRGGVLAVVEVKRRRTLDEALQAVGPVQRARLQRAGLALAERFRGPAGPATVRLDLLALAPGRLPRHVPDAWGGAREVREGGTWP